MKTPIVPGVLMDEGAFVCLLEKYFQTSHSSFSDLGLKLYQTESKCKFFSESLCSLHTITKLQGSTPFLHPS